MLPDVPVEAKLFNYRLNTDNAASKYEFSSIELYDEHTLPVDYNMGMRIDLVDKEVYSVNPVGTRAANLASTQKQASKESGSAAAAVTL